MKVIKSILITLIALLLTGCYTQLQYSQKMNKVTDRNKKEVTENYQDGEERATSEAEAETEEEYAEYDGEQNAVPVYYKDYEYVERYNDCNCSPYNVYNFYGSSYDWYGYNHHRPFYSFRSHLSLSSFYFHKWHHRRFMGYPRFAFSFSWGSPHFHSFYNNPFYDYYGHGYSPFAYNYHRYYGSFGYGYYYGGSKQDVERDDDTRYGPRSIGTNRVVDGDRTRSVSNETGRSATVTNSRSAGQSRSSSVGTRSRDSANKSSGSDVTRTRSRSDSDNNSSGTTRSRSGDNIQSDNSRDRVYIDRTGDSESVLVDRDRYNAIRARTAATQKSVQNSDTEERKTLQRVRRVNLNSEKQEKPTFFQRMKGFFENNTGRIITNSTRSSSSTIRSRSSSSSNRSSVSRSKSSSSSRSSVSRSKSSSSNSRSRGGSSSSSRSRSGGDSDSSSSDRSRGN